MLIFVRDDCCKYDNFTKKCSFLLLLKCSEAGGERTLDLTQPLQGQLTSRSRNKKPAVYLRFQEPDPMCGHISIYPKGLRWFILFYMYLRWLLDWKLFCLEWGGQICVSCHLRHFLLLQARSDSFVLATVWRIFLVFFPKCKPIFWSYMNQTRPVLCPTMMSVPYGSVFCEPLFSSTNCGLVISVDCGIVNMLRCESEEK
jgi:hypothetical protein